MFNAWQFPSPWKGCYTICLSVRWYPTEDRVSHQEWHTSSCFLYTMFDDLTVGKEKHTNSRARSLRCDALSSTWTPIGWKEDTFNEERAWVVIVFNFISLYSHHVFTYCVVVHIEHSLPCHALYIALMRLSLVVATPTGLSTYNLPKWVPLNISRFCRVKYYF